MLKLTDDELEKLLLKDTNLGCESKLQLVRWLQCLASENQELRQQVRKVKEPPQATCFSFWQWVWYWF